MRYFETVITSRQNEKISDLCRLNDKKYREQERLFRFDGFKLLFEALSKQIVIRSVFLREDIVLPEAIGEKLSQTDAVLYRISASLFDRISDEKSPEGVITTAEYIDKFFNHAIIKEEEKLQMIQSSVPSDAPALFLESIQDPQNFGALIRSAAAFGVSCVICDGSCADKYHPKALRASMGAIFSMPCITVSDLPRAVSEMARTHRVFAAALHTDSMPLGTFEKRSGDCLIIGNEGHGVSGAVLDAATGSVIIPMDRGVESLNAAVAAGILLWEFRGRR